MKWLRRLLQRQKKTNLRPEALWHISIDDTHFLLRNPTGTTNRLSINELSGVAIETNNRGPWDIDLWWLLFGADDKMAIAFPGGATGEQLTLDWLMKLPNFDHAQLTEAIKSTRIATFPLWRKPAN